MNITFTYVFHSIIDSIYLRVLHGAFFCFSEFVTFVCYSGFLYYEFFGGDPMKRSLKNKLLSQSAVFIIVSSLTNHPGLNAFNFCAESQFLVSFQNKRVLKCC